MEMKPGAKKKIAITVTAVLLALFALFAVLYRNYTKEICVIEPVEHMGQREGVSMNGILVEINYGYIVNGEYNDNYLYVFKNGDVYSGYCDNYNKEGVERESYYYHMDNKYWDYLYEQCYWGRLSLRDLNGVINELAQVDDFSCYYREEDVMPMPQSQSEVQSTQTYELENSDIYAGHLYRIRMERDETEVLGWVSKGYDEEIIYYLYNEHAHNAIDIVKSTWAYRQWTNQLFGEGWEERIDLKDELDGMEREKNGGGQWILFLKSIWDSFLSSIGLQ